MNANEQVIRAVFDRTARGDTRALVDALADDCSWTFPGNWSWSQTFAPKSEVVGRLLVPLTRQFDGGYRLEADLVLVDGDRVVVQGRGYAVTRRGAAYNQTYCFILQLRDGLIVEVIEHCDTALVERVLDPV